MGRRTAETTLLLSIHPSFFFLGTASSSCRVNQVRSSARGEFLLNYQLVAIIATRTGHPDRKNCPGRLIRYKLQSDRNYVVCRDISDWIMILTLCIVYY